MCGLCLGLVFVNFRGFGCGFALRGDLVVCGLSLRLIVVFHKCFVYWFYWYFANFRRCFNI